MSNRAYTDDTVSKVPTQVTEKAANAAGAKLVLRKKVLLTIKSGVVAGMPPITPTTEQWPEEQC